MVFNDTSTKLGIVQGVDFEVNTALISYPLADKTREANIGLDEALAIIMEVDSTWQFDDTNFTDLPIGTTNLVSGQADYSFPSELLSLEKVQVLDPSGEWFDMQRIEKSDPTYEQIIIEEQQANGTPKYFDIVGRSMVMYPAPNYAQTAGVKTFFQRLPSYFVATDTTKEPGFAKHLHKFLVLHIAHAYAEANGDSRANRLLQRKQLWIEKIRSHYGQRDKKYHASFSPLVESNK